MDGRTYVRTYVITYDGKECSKRREKNDDKNNNNKKKKI